MSPVFQKASGFRRYLPLIRVWQTPPCIDATANFVDDRSGIVRLSLGRKSLPSSSTNPDCPAALRFFGFGIGVMNFALRRCSNIFWGGLSGFVKFLMPRRALVG
jgi:hypothetical protein